MQHARRRPVLVLMSALLVLGALVMAACGPGEEPEPDPKTVEIDLAEDVEEAHFYFVRSGEERPDRDEDHVIQVAADGAPIIFVLTNVGEVDHDFVIEALDIDYHLEPGESVETDPYEIAPGEYLVECTELGHYDLGMRFTLIVE